MPGPFLALQILQFYMVSKGTKHLIWQQLQGQGNLNLVLGGDSNFCGSILLPLHSRQLEVHAPLPQFLLPL